MATLATKGPPNSPQCVVLYSPGESSEMCARTMGPKTVSVLSYNLLLPNSVDGWWTYKNYCPNTPMEARSWPSRQELLARKIEMESPDIICFQEASDRSYESDFEFLTSAGWSYHIHTKGKARMRTMTLWNSALFEVVGEESYFKDHCLVTPFRVRITNDIFWVINCHLQAGLHAGDRRLRQLHEALETVRKKSKTLAISQERVLVCGDFNSNSDDILATHQYLLRGKVEGGFEEYGKAVTSKTKNCAVHPFQDAYQVAYAESSNPPTMIAPSLIPRMESSRDASAKEGQTETYRGEVQPSDNFVAACILLFRVYADCSLPAGGETEGVKSLMSREAVEKWLMDINNSVERGDEMRNAFSIFDTKKEERLSEGCEEGEDFFSVDDFLTVYCKELQHGKYWGIASDFRRIAAKFNILPDLAACEVLPPFYVEGREPTSEEAETDLYLGKIDYIFFTPSTFRCEGVLDISANSGIGRRRPIPDSTECSDHFCLKAVFSLI
jgi:exonuclease III